MSESSFVQFAQGVDHQRSFGSTKGDLKPNPRSWGKAFLFNRDTFQGNTSQFGVTDWHPEMSMAEEAVYCVRGFKNECPTSPVSARLTVHLALLANAHLEASPHVAKTITATPQVAQPSMDYGQHR